jgi:ElaB/YqjD/DUF883 family membrane-anchored ribosome-binding protein
MKNPDIRVQPKTTADPGTTTAASPSAARPDTLEPLPSDDTGEIREKIERTREDMSHTIDELQERLSPQHVMERAKTNVREATVDTARHLAERAQDAASTVAHEAREHPVTAALIGAGVAWLALGTSLFGSRKGRGRRGRYGNGDALLNEEFEYRIVEYGVPGGPMMLARVRVDATDRDQGGYSMDNGYSTGGWTQVFRDHPIPTTLAAASIGYLIMQQRGDSGVRRRDLSDYRYRTRRSAAAYPGEGVYSSSAYGSTGESWSDSMRHARDEAGGKMSELRGQMSDMGEQVGENVRHAGERVREGASDLAENVQETWEHARHRTVSEFDEWMEDNPLAVGAAALALGMALGFSAPRTRVEDQTLGSARDSLIDSTTQAAKEAAQEVKQRVSSAAENVTNIVGGGSSESESSQGGDKGRQGHERPPLL